jgi:hypothetical protein
LREFLREASLAGLEAANIPPGRILPGSARDRIVLALPAVAAGSPARPERRLSKRRLRIPVFRITERTRETPHRSPGSQQEH